MTRKRILRCDDPNCPHERLLLPSDWIRESLPDSYTGFRVSDLDFILYNKNTRKLMLLEVKTNSDTMKEWQEKLFKVLDIIIKEGVKYISPPIKYYGFHCLRFENTSFKSGSCRFDDVVTPEEEVLRILSMED